MQEALSFFRVFVPVAAPIMRKGRFYMSKQKKTLFRGAATALITPFSNGRIDFEALGLLIERQIKGGIGALVIAGTTGESATLSDAEKIALFAFSAERIAGRVPLIAGVGCADTAHTVTLSRSACAAGADALLVVTPYYNRPSQAGLRAHFEAVADAAEKPVILYSVPGRTGVTVSTDTYITPTLIRPLRPMRQPLRLSSMRQRSTALSSSPPPHSAMRPSLMLLSVLTRS